jgi:hypothetical protein
MMPDPITTAVVTLGGGIFGVWRARVNARRDERIAEIGRAQAEAAADELRQRVRDLETALIDARAEIAELKKMIG